MDAFRRTRYAATLLILFMALFVSAETAFLSVQAVSPAITLAPTSGPVDTSVVISGSSFSTSPADTSCTITSSSTNIIASATCTVNAGTLVSSGFTVAIGSKPGTYTITVTGNAGGSGDFGQSTFVVTSPSITLSPGSQRIGGEVLVNGTGFSPQDGSCSISSPTNPSVITVSGCSITHGPTPTSTTNETKGSFIVGNVPTGQYTIEVTGCPGNNPCSPSAGDFAQAVLEVSGGAQLFLIPSKGPVGQHVSIEGGFFSASDTTCSISSPSSGSVVVDAGCAIISSSSIKNVTGSFVVGNVPEGQYVIQATGNTGDFAQAVFNVTAGAFIQLGVNGIFVKVGQVASGTIGTHVSIEGSQFLPNDALNSATCSVGSPSNGNAVLNGACSFFKTTGGFVNVTGSFVVGNVPEGQYVIQVSGSAGDSAQAVFNVTAGAFIQLGVNGIFPKTGKVASGPIGTHVSIEGSNFLANDAFNSATCSVGSPSNGNVISNGACSFFKTTGGFVNVTGSFVVGNVPEGQYVIQVSGSAGDSAEAIFNVTAGAFIQLGVAIGTKANVFQPVGQPASGPIGTHVSIEGSQFLANDAFNSATCSLGSPSNGAVISNGACSFFETTGGFVNVTGSFVIGNVPEGQYVIQVSGSAGDSAQAVLNVTAGAFIQLSGLSGGFVKIGQVASGPTGTHVNIEGSQFLANDAFNSATCSISSPTSGSILTGQACSFFKTTTGLVNVTGSFIVGNVNPGQYVIQVSGSAGDSAQAIFNVTAGPFIQLTGITGGFASLGKAAKGPVGTHVSVSGSNFLSTDTTCSLSSPSSGSFIQSGACAVFVAGSGFKNVTASFIVGNVPEGQYLVQVSGNAGDFAQAVFNVTRGPFIQLFPQKGSTGRSVQIEGSYFLSTDTTCSLSSPSSGTIIQGGACSTFKASSGLFLGFMNVTGSFIVGNVAPGQYVIQVSGNQGDFAQAIFNVTSGPFIQLRASGFAGGFASVGQVVSGPIGTSVAVEGSFFPASTTTTCIITSPTSGSIIQGAGCSVFIPTSGFFLGFANVTGSFIVGNVLPGQYVIQVTGNEGSFATAIFNVTLGAKITLSPGSAPPGHDVIVNGTGFLPTDTACTISSPGSGAVLPGSAGCAVRAGTGIVGGSFIVGNVVPGQYVIQVTGNQGDFAQAVLNVTAGPKLSVSPGSGIIGTSILVNGTGFLTTDQSCSISSISTPNPILLGSSACVITVGSGIVRGSFIIGPVPPGEYVIEVTGCAGNNGCAPSAGDFAQAIVTVLPSPKSLTIFPTNATEGSTVTFIGSGLSPSDTGCTLIVYNDNHGLDTNLLTSSTCSITSPGTAKGGFVVSPYATTNIPWNLTVRGTPANDLTPFAFFNVTADVVVTPTSGTIHTVFTFTGSGFSSAATTCNATIVPPFPSGSGAGCYMSANTGQVSGSVVVPVNTVPGTYALYVKDNTGKLAAGVFTVGTPSALVVLNPASVDQSQPVGVAGFGFNPNDTFCVITANNPNLFAAPGPVCTISGGYAAGSFTVSSTAQGGYYLITVTACKAAFTGLGAACPAAETLDFASNFLGVTLASTVTTFSTTTTSSTSTTSMSTTTTSIATSFSFSSTTYSTTGIFFTTYTHNTASTVSGRTTTTMTSTTSTTQTQTTVTVSTTTSFTTVPCGPLPCGFAIQPAPVNPAPGIDSVGLLAAILLVIPMLLRRLFG